MWRVGVAPDFPQQFTSMNHMILTCREIPQQFEFFVGQRNCAAAFGCGPGLKINDDLAKHNPVDVHQCPSKDGMDASEELLEVEWFGDVVVRAEIQAAKSVGFCS